MRRHHELPFGAEPVPEGVRFRLWAPKAKAVSLSLDGTGELAMAPESGGWFHLTTAAARAGSRYRYVVDGQSVPDPASRYQPEDVHGPSEVIDPRSYHWRDSLWPGRRWEEIVLYELHVGTFSERGDFAGVEHHLDHLAALGVDAAVVEEPIPGRLIFATGEAPSDKLQPRSAAFLLAEPSGG